MRNVTDKPDKFPPQETEAGWSDATFLLVVVASCLTYAAGLKAAVSCQSERVAEFNEATLQNVPTETTEISAPSEK